MFDNTPSCIIFNKVSSWQSLIKYLYTKCKVCSIRLTHWQQNKEDSVNQNRHYQQAIMQISFSTEFLGPTGFTDKKERLLHRRLHSQLDLSCSNFCGSMKGLSMDLIISSPQYAHSDATMSSMSDMICSRLVAPMPFPRLAVSPSSFWAVRWRDLEDCVVAASFFWSSSRRFCLKADRWGVTSYMVGKQNTQKKSHLGC